MSLIVFALATLYGIFGWTYTTQLIGDLCLNGKPEPSPYPQIRDLVGLTMAATTMIAVSWLLSTGQPPPPIEWTPPPWWTVRVWA